jgi:hypothetical protein
MSPYYTFKNDPVYDLEIEGTNAAGRNTKWTYDEGKKTIAISGNGSMAGNSLWGFLGIKEIDTIIIGSGVNRIETGAITSGITFVDFHGKDDEIIFDKNFASDGTILNAMIIEL